MFDLRDGDVEAVPESGLEAAQGLSFVLEGSSPREMEVQGQKADRHSRLRASDALFEGFFDLLCREELDHVRGLEVVVVRDADAALEAGLHL